MKKLLSLLVIALMATSPMFSQAWGEGILSVPKRVWTDPVIYNYDEDVTWYFDLSGEDDAIKSILDEATLALWTWVPSNPGDGHFGGGYNLAQPEMVLTHRGGYVYSITLKPTTFYNVTSSYIENPHYSGEWEMSSFVMHIRVFSKERDADINCDAFHIRYPHFLIKDLKEKKIPHAVYPIEANATTPMAIVVAKDSIASFTGDLFIDSNINDEAYSVAYDAANPDKTKLKTYFGINDAYVLNIKNPSQYYGFSENYEITKLHFEVKTAGSQTSLLTSDYPITPASPWVPSGIEYNTTTPENLKAYVLNGILYVDAQSFDVYSISGALVAKSDSASLDISNLSNGTYIIKSPNGTVKLLR